jgi:hypothetical protein
VGGNPNDPLTKPTSKELIMATPDHKALVRPSNPFDGTFSPFPRRPRHSADTLEATQQRICSKLAGIEIAVHGLQCLLDDSDAFHGARASGLPTEPSRWPLTSVHVANFAVAIHFLKEYAGVLGRE